MVNKLEFQVLGVQKILLIWTKQDSNSASTPKVRHTIPQEKRVCCGKLEKDKTNSSVLSNLYILLMVCHAQTFVFKGTGQRIATKEKKQNDNRVVVQFHCLVQGKCFVQLGYYVAICIRSICGILVVSFALINVSDCLYKMSITAKQPRVKQAFEG